MPGRSLHLVIITRVVERSIGDQDHDAYDKFDAVKVT